MKTMPIVHYPMMNVSMIMPEFKEKKEKECKRYNIENEEDIERGTEKKFITPKPAPVQPKIPIYVTPQKPVHIPPEKPAETIVKVETEQETINILNKVEVEAPDVINTLITLGLSLEAARQLIKTIIKLSHKHKN
jgi:hypothetical protein